MFLGCLDLDISIYLSIYSICGFQGTFVTDVLSVSGDGEIRTLDPLLARQVLVDSFKCLHLVFTFMSFNMTSDVLIFLSVFLICGFQGTLPNKIFTALDACIHKHWDILLASVPARDRAVLLRGAM